MTVLFTVVNEDAIRAIYRHPWMQNVRFEQTLTGFVPEHLLERSVPPYEKRKTDVAYRARKVPSWLGGFGQEKWEIGQRFKEESKKYGLRCDIAFSEAERIYGEKWIKFISGAKAVLGTESGASVIDFDDKIRNAVEAYEAQCPDVSFEDVQNKCFKDQDGDVVIHVISPRCFEAAALRTLMILYPGEYSGVLEEGRHYVPLEKDHSNMDEVVETLRDPKRAGEIVENAYKEIASSGRWTFATMVAHFDNVIQEEALARIPKEQIDARPVLEKKEISEWQTKIKWYSYILKLKHLVIRIIQIALGNVRKIVKSLPDPIYDFAIKPLVPFIYQVEKLIRKWLLGSTS
ncbi:MAG: glycosyltransferase [Hyphomicrobiaceae bacterium]|nr:glycosyltransferase [Hyphomicrobiaceae bacterium]